MEEITTNVNRSMMGSVR